MTMTSRNSMRAGKVASAVAALAVTVASLSGCTIPSSENAAAFSGNQVDAAAIVGALAVAQQIPGSASGKVSEAIGQLAAAKNGSKTQIDVGVSGNQVVDYQVGSKGSEAPFCIAMTHPAVKEIKPTQKSWVAYYEPSSGAKAAVLVIRQGLADCSSAEAYAKGLTDNGSRQAATQASQDLVKYSLLLMNILDLTRAGLALFQQAREAASQATPAPQSAPAATP